MYYVEITGRNTAQAYAYDSKVRIFAFPSMTTNTGRVLVRDRGAEDKPEVSPAKVAIFTSEAEAIFAAQACRWNNQGYRVKRLRGADGVRILALGRIVETTETWTSCQEEYAANVGC